MNDKSPHEAPPPPALSAAAEQLSRLLRNAIVSNEARSQELRDGIRDYTSWDHRRASWSERDRACYRLGGSFEPTQGHLIDPIAMTGLDHLGATGLVLLAEAAIANPGLSLSGIMSALFNGPRGPLVRDWGVWAWGNWCRNLYLDETVTFLQSKTGRDPKARWRNGKVTARQRHLIREISRSLEVLEVTFSNRGAAFDWIKQHGGNPRFLTPPVQPELPRFEEAMS